MGKRSRKSAPQVDIEEPNRRQKKILNHNLRLSELKPLTKNQEKVFHSYFSGKNVIMTGCAGTGKTFVGLYLALNDLMQGLAKKVVIVRSAVSTRDQGFLPGTIVEKMSMYEQPYKNIVSDLMNNRKDAYELLQKKDALEFMSTSFLRGLTIDDAVIIIDEAQNLSDHELSSVLTRVGHNTRIIVCGDTYQDDLKHLGKKSQTSGLLSLLICANYMKSFDIVDFDIEDIVRSGFVKEYLLARMKAGLI
jgi:phosphate starvation-inducible protein PhoH